MNDKERELFDSLIKAAGTLATVADNAAVILSEQFEEMIRPQIEAVRAIIEQCPSPTAAWDGELRESDIKETIKDKVMGGFAGSGKGVGVHVLHLPTGLGRMSDSKPSQEENRTVALKALTQAVEREMKDRG